MQDPKNFKTFRRRRSLRLNEFDYAQPWACYHVIIGTYEAHPCFTNEALNCEIIATLRTLANQYGYAVIAFCLMPDHLHLLVQAKEDCRSLEQFVGAFKGVTTRIYWRHGGRGKLWQRSFYEHIVRKMEDLTVISDYILSNPMRAGLVEDPRDYPWSGQWDDAM